MILNQNGKIEVIMTVNKIERLQEEKGDLKLELPYFWNRFIFVYDRNNAGAGKSF